MRPRPQEADDTVRWQPAPPPPQRGRGAIWAALLGIAVLAGLSGWWLWPPSAPRPVFPAPPVRAPAPVPLPGAAHVPAPAVAPQAAAPPAVQAPETFAIATADEQQILDHVATTLTVFRFAPNPRIVVLDFPTLLQQGLMLDRVAALVEKAGLPRTRVLTDAELDAAIRAHGDTVSNYYYGHDYPAAAIARFFALADKERVQLNAAENRLRALAQQLGWFTPGAEGALITIPRVGADRYVTLAARAAILHHELSHGEFFSDQRYADYVRRFWWTALTTEERARVRHFLGSEEYDTSDEDLMLNEMQAYLMFTYDPEFFKPADVGMTAARRIALQRDFLKGMPAGWLHDDLAGAVIAGR